MADLTKIKYMVPTWSDIDQWVDKITKKIKKSDFKPEVVIALTRGGWVPARIICDHLIIKELYAIKTEHWGLTATRDGSAKLRDKISVDLTNKKVLIVDDITDTGQSLKLAMDHVYRHSPSVLKTATLIHISHSSVEPDFYAELMKEENWRWVIFPWNYREDIKNILSNYKDISDNYEEITDRIKKDINISVDPLLIKDLLTD
ncbi:MAG: phosphoribosyltransferase [Thermoplasmata archaeon]